MLLHCLHMFPERSVDGGMVVWWCSFIITDSRWWDISSQFKIFHDMIYVVCYFSVNFHGPTKLAALIQSTALFCYYWMGPHVYVPARSLRCTNSKVWKFLIYLYSCILLAACILSPCINKFIESVMLLGAVILGTTVTLAMTILSFK